jgi:hypothetical protein
MTNVRVVVVSENQFHSYKAPRYDLKPGETVLSADVKRESGNQLTLYLAVLTEEHGADEVDFPEPKMEVRG